MDYMAKTRIRRGSRVYVYERENYRDSTGKVKHRNTPVGCGHPGWRAVLAILMSSVSIALITPLNAANKTTEITNATICFFHFNF